MHPRRGFVHRSQARPHSSTTCRSHTGASPGMQGGYGLVGRPTAPRRCVVRQLDLQLRQRLRSGIRPSSNRGRPDPAVVVTARAAWGADPVAVNPTRRAAANAAYSASVKAAVTRRDRAGNRCRRSRPGPGRSHRPGHQRRTGRSIRARRVGQPGRRSEVEPIGGGANAALTPTGQGCPRWSPPAVEDPARGNATLCPAPSANRARSPSSAGHFIACSAPAAVRPRQRSSAPMSRLMLSHRQKDSSTRHATMNIAPIARQRRCGRAELSNQLSNNGDEHDGTRTVSIAAKRLCTKLFGVRSGAKNHSRRRGHWFDPSIAHSLHLRR